MCSLGQQAGLFSAVTSAFIIEVNSELQPDPNEETAALLRVIIHKMDNTTFGGNVPAVPQWTGPPHMVVRVQAILFASLAASLLSAFLAMLGKQWLNRYASADVRGSVIERGQNRQRKLDGIVTWYFDHVMQSLPLMLQVALLLLGCALSRYLWGINTTVASVVIGVTSFGILFYLFIIVAGAAFLSCPYQTPGAQILRCIPDVICRIPEVVRSTRRLLHRIPDSFRWIPKVPAALHPVFSAAVKGSTCCDLFTAVWDYLNASHSSQGDTLRGLSPTLYIFLIPVWLVMDACKVTGWLLIGFSRGIYSWSQQVPETPVAMLDLHCISWTLRTSLDGPVRLSTLNYLAITTLANPDSALIAGCFDVLTSCVKATDDGAAITQGMEQLATVTALCCLRTLSHLTVTDPMLMTLASVRQQYARAFPPGTDFHTLPFSHTLGAVHRILYPENRFAHSWTPRWENCRSSSDGCAIVAHALAQISRFWCRQRRREKVPCWLLCFVLHSLSRYPLPSTSVVVSCLSIVAIDLGCDPSSAAILDERCVCT